MNVLSRTASNYYKKSLVLKTIITMMLNSHDSTVYVVTDD